MTQGIKTLELTRGVLEFLLKAIGKSLRFITNLRNDVNRMIAEEHVIETYIINSGATATTVGDISAVEYVSINGAIEFPTKYTYTGNTITFTPARFTAGSEVIIKYIPL